VARIKLSFLIAVLASYLTGCATTSQMEVSPLTQRVFTYDFQLQGKSKRELFNLGRNHIATTYGDSEKVIRVSDKEEGLILGKALSMWPVLFIECPVEYHIRFAAKEHRARVQYELINKRPAISKCTGWPWLTAAGYEKITNDFKKYAEDFESSLNDKSEAASFTKF
jgi:hypothetical protein